MDTKRTGPAFKVVTWLGHFSRTVRVITTALLLVGWFIVAGTLAAVQVIRDDISPSRA